MQTLKKNNQCSLIKKFIDGDFQIFCLVCFEFIKGLFEFSVSMVYFVGNKAKERISKRLWNTRFEICSFALPAIYDPVKDL